MFIFFLYLPKWFFLAHLPVFLCLWYAQYNLHSQLQSKASWFPSPSNRVYPTIKFLLSAFHCLNCWISAQIFSTVHDAHWLSTNKALSKDCSETCKITLSQWLYLWWFINFWKSRPKYQKSSLMGLWFIFLDWTTSSLLTL